MSEFTGPRCTGSTSGKELFNSSMKRTGLVQVHVYTLVERNYVLIQQSARAGARG